MHRNKVNKKLTKNCMFARGETPKRWVLIFWYVLIWQKFEESIKVNVYENVRFGELAKIGYNLFWSKKYKIWIFWTLFPLTKLTRNHELQFLLFDRTRSLSLFAWSTRGGTICSNRGPAPRTWGGYAQKGRNRWFQQRPRSNDQGAASHCAICLQRHRGPNNFYRPASTFSFHLESIFLSPAELRKFDKGIGDRRDCQKIMLKNGRKFSSGVLVVCVRKSTHRDVRGPNKFWNTLKLFWKLFLSLSGLPPLCTP